MPRGPGKPENYNFDYSRFSGVGADADDEGRRANTDANEFQDLLSRVPGELREAHRMQQLANQTGDPAAMERARELVMGAMQKSDPEVKKKFIENLAKEQPEVAGQLSASLFSPNADKVMPEVILKGVCPDTGFTAGVDVLKQQMQASADTAKAHMDALQRQHDQLMAVSTPEDFMKAMHANGLSNEDLQRIFTGDVEHMEKKAEDMISLATGETPAVSDGADQALEAVEELHDTLFGSDASASKSGRRKSDRAEALEDRATDAAEAKPVPAPPKPPDEPEVEVPMYRLQYKKGADGRYEAVELTCCLPGVADMSAILLDVSEKHVRLTTCPPAPRFAVNSGPFPVLIDPSRARAKYSRKREELKVTVPAKAAPVRT